MFLCMLDPAMALVEISGEGHNCQKIQWPRMASEEKATMHHEKVILPRVGDFLIEIWVKLYNCQPRKGKSLCM